MHGATGTRNPEPAADSGARKSTLRGGCDDQRTGCHECPRRASNRTRSIHLDAPARPGPNILATWWPGVGPVTRIPGYRDRLHRHRWAVHRSLQPICRTGVRLPAARRRRTAPRLVGPPWDMLTTPSTFARRSLLFEWELRSSPIPAGASMRLGVTLISICAGTSSRSRSTRRATITPNASLAQWRHRLQHRQYRHLSGDVASMALPARHADDRRRRSTRRTEP